MSLTTSAVTASALFQLQPDSPVSDELSSSPHSVTSSLSLDSDISLKTSSSDDEDFADTLKKTDRYAVEDGWDSDSDEKAVSQARTPLRVAASASTPVQSKSKFFGGSDSDSSPTSSPEKEVRAPVRTLSGSASAATPTKKPEKPKSKFFGGSDSDSSPTTSPEKEVRVPVRALSGSASAATPTKTPERPKSKFFGGSDSSAENSPESSPEKAVSSPGFNAAGFEVLPGRHPLFELTAKAKSASLADDDDWLASPATPAASPGKPTSKAPGAGAGSHFAAVKKHKETPQQTRDMVALLGQVDTENALTKGERAKFTAGMQGLAKMDDTPGRKHKAATVHKVARALMGNLSAQAAPGSAAYHRNGTKALAEAATWVTKDVVPELRAMQKSCVHVPDEPLFTPFREAGHLSAAKVKGKSSIIGLHIFGDDFADKYVCHELIENPVTGVCAVLFSMKADKASKQKFSTFFPRAITLEEQAWKLVDGGSQVARCENRVLYDTGISEDFYVEVFMGDAGLKERSAFPVFACKQYQKDGVYEIPKVIKLSAAEVLSLTKQALIKVNPHVMEQNSPLRYVCNVAGRAELIIDIAPFVKTKVQQGILVRIGADAFADSDLAKQVALIVKKWA